MILSALRRRRVRPRASQDVIDKGLALDTAAAGFLAKLIEHSRIHSDRDQLAGLLPRGGQPTRRIAISCAADESAMSEKSMSRRVRRALAAAGPPCADDPDRFRIALFPQCVRDHEHVSVRIGQAAETATLPPSAAGPGRQDPPWHIYRIPFSRSAWTFIALNEIAGGGIATSRAICFERDR